MSVSNLWQVVMNLWAISDLHLSFAQPDPHKRYATRSRDHAARIEEHSRKATSGRLTWC